MYKRIKKYEDKIKIKKYKYIEKVKTERGNRFMEFQGLCPSFLILRRTIRLYDIALYGKKKTRGKQQISARNALISRATLFHISIIMKITK